MIYLAHDKCKKKHDTSNSMGNWKHLRIIQKTPEQHTEKARHEDYAENSRTAHCALLRKLLIQKYKTSIIGSSITRTTNFNRRIAATLNTVETSLVSGIY